MKNKIILYIIGILILVGTATAIQIGDILTQNEIERIDFDAVNLNCSAIKHYISLTTFTINTKFQCMSLERKGEKYKVIWEKWIEQYSIFRYLDCRNPASETMSDKPYCISVMKTDFLSKFNWHKSMIRKQLKKFQIPMDLTIGDFNITTGDLN